MSTWKIVAAIMTVSIGLGVYGAAQSVIEDPRICRFADQTGLKYICRVMRKDGR